MTQSILTLLTIAAAGIYLARFIHRTYFSKKTKCDGCAVKKLYEAKGS